VRLLLIRESNTIYRYSNTSYGLGMVGTVASEIAQVKIIDNNSIHVLYSPHELLDKAAQFKPDVIGFNIHAFNILASRELIAQTKQRFPGLCLIAGGLHTYAEPGEVAETGVHIVVKGEAEPLIKPLLKILERFSVSETSKPFTIGAELAAELTHIPGLEFQQEGKEHRSDTGQPGFVHDLDTLPFINYDLFNLEDFLKHSGDDHYVTNVLITQRGCPYPCSFCRVEGSAALVKVRENSTAYRLAYVDYLLNRFKPGHIIFYDNNFTLKRQSAIDFCRGYVERQFHRKTTFSCQTNVALNLDKDLLAAMKAARCTEVGLGIERLSQRALTLIRKNRNYDRILSNLELLNHFGIDVLANCLIGFPFDTPETVAEESRLFGEVKDKIKVFAINNLLPPPGTDVYQQTSYQRWYLQERFMHWKPSFYHMVFNFSNNAWDVNFFNLDRETQNAIRLMKERYYSLTIAKMDSRVIDILHFFEKILARISLAAFRIHPTFENILFYFPKKTRILLHNYFLTKYYIPRNNALNEESLL